MDKLVRKIEVPLEKNAVKKAGCILCRRSDCVETERELRNRVDAEIRG